MVLRQAQHERWKVFVTFLPIALLLLGASPAGGSDILVQVRHVRDARGRVHVDICAKSNFLKSDCPWSGEAPSVAGTTSVVVHDIPPGTYAAQVFQDANGNGKVDRLLLGLPKEGVGFSNDAKIRLGPPKFAEAAFTHGADAQTISLSLRYFLP